MKTLLLILLCLPMIGFGQSNDVLKLQNDVDNINYRMEKHHKQFYAGVKVGFVGSGAFVVGVLTSSIPLIYVGSAITFLSQIVILDSHKWFKNKDRTTIKEVSEVLDEIDWKLHTAKIKKRTKELDNLLKKGKITREEYDDAIKELNNLKQ